MFNIKGCINDFRDTAVSVCSILKLRKILKQTKKCLLISNGSTLSGAPLVLLEAAKVLKKNGYTPIIFTEYRGPILRVAKKEDINVVVGARLLSVFKSKLLASEFEMILVNTIVYYKWIEIFKNTGVHIIWWLHEGKTYIEKVVSNLPKALPKDIDVYCVSSWTAKALAREGIDYEYEILNYGCTDLCSQREIEHNHIFNDSRITVAIIGNICTRKNQLDLIRNLESLPKAILDAYEFIFVGTPLSYEDIYYKQFVTALQNSKVNTRYIKTISREDMPDFYNSIDVVLCCSTDDPLPVVVTEGMMFGKIVITSSCTGQYDLIQHGINGFKYQVEDFRMLSDIFTYIANNRHQLCTISKQARKTYEEFFSPDAFEERLLYILRK